MLDSLLQYDQELFLHLNGLGSDSWDGFWLALSNKWVSVPLYLILLITSYKAFGLRSTLILLVSVALMITATDQLANFFKNGVQRLRPCHDPGLQNIMRLVKAYCGGKFGFYSAHASNSMALAVFFTILLGRRHAVLGPFLVTWALIVGYSRIYIGVHYPLDVLSGAGMGIFLGWLFARLYTMAVYRMDK